MRKKIKRIKMYKKLHESKEAANSHIAKIKARDGEVKQSVQNGKILLEYYFPDKNIIKGDYVWKYFLGYGSENHSKDENPMFDWKDQVLKTNYVERELLISNLLKNDVDLKEFFESEKQDDFSSYKKNRTVNKNIIIGNSNYANDVVIDGYHRIVQNIVNGKNTVMAFVPTNSKFVN